jgi:hypothetical protein
MPSAARGCRLCIIRKLRCKCNALNLEDGEGHLSHDSFAFRTQRPRLPPSVHTAPFQGEDSQAKWRNKQIYLFLLFIIGVYIKYHLIGRVWHFNLGSYVRHNRIVPINIYTHQIQDTMIQNVYYLRLHFFSCTTDKWSLSPSMKNSPFWSLSMKEVLQNRFLIQAFERERADSRSLVRGGAWMRECVIAWSRWTLGPFLYVAPTSPFIASKRRACVTFVVKKWK